MAKSIFNLQFINPTTFSIPGDAHRDLLNCCCAGCTSLEATGDLAAWIQAADNKQQQQISGWWFGTCFIFPDIGNVMVPTDFHIFERG